MECVLRGLTWDRCLIYLDDIIIYSKSFKSHVEDLKIVFERLRRANLKLKPSKCSFGKRSVNYLGHVVSAEGVKPDKSKIELVQEFPAPKNQKQVKQFLGLAGYYRRFIKDYANIASPLNSLLQKNKKFDWNDKCETAFQTLKERLVTEPILSYPDFSKPFELYVDSSGVAIGMVLGQFQNGMEKVIAYGGRSLSAAERNYSTTEQEALAVIAGIKHFHPYLTGRQFIVHTDHHSLKWLLGLKMSRGRLARWSLLIQQYDFIVKHRPGRVHSNADVLSRHPKYETLNAITTAQFETQDMRKLQENQRNLKNIILYLEQEILVGSQEEQLKTLAVVDKYLLDAEGVLFYLPSKGKENENLEKLVIPDKLVEKILQATHDNITGGHFSLQKTYQKIKEKCYWQGMYRDCKHWIESCEVCSTHKVNPRAKKANLQIFPHAKEPFQRIGVDIAGPFTVTEDNNKYIMVAVDHFTKWTEAWALPHTEAHLLANPRKYALQ